MAVMYRGMAEESLPERQSFTLALILTPLGFSSGILAAFEGQII